MRTLHVLAAAALRTLMAVRGSDGVMGREHSHYGSKITVVDGWCDWV
jgi:hypothetical protein